MPISTYCVPGIGLSTRKTGQYPGRLIAGSHHLTTIPEGWFALRTLISKLLRGWNVAPTPGTRLLPRKPQPLALCVACWLLCWERKRFWPTEEYPLDTKEDFLKETFILKCFPLENQYLSSLYPLFLEEFARSFCRGWG